MTILLLPERTPTCLYSPLLSSWRFFLKISFVFSLLHHFIAFLQHDPLTHLPTSISPFMNCWTPTFKSIDPVLGPFFFPFLLIIFK